MEEDKLLDNAARAARVGGRVVDSAFSVFLLFFLFMGGYIIWYTVMVYQSAFLDEDILKYKPAPGQEYNPTLDDLVKINPDVCAWISIDDTHIDYPVVRGEDNLEYLNKDIFGEFSLSGAVFLDKENERDFSDPYNILYGHHMDNEAMFGQVIDFLEEDFFDEHPTGTLYLPNKTYTISLFACMETNAYEPRVLSVKKKSTEIPSMLSYIHNHAAQYRDLSPALSGSDKIIGLVTCERIYTDGRVLLLGRLEETNYVHQGDDHPEPEKEEEWLDE